MQIVEQSAIINAPLKTVSSWMHDLESVPRWATVPGTMQNPQGEGAGKTYDWRFKAGPIHFSGKIQIVEMQETSLITRTTGDIDSLWTINLRPISKNSTAIRVTVEFTPPHAFLEPLADVVMQQLATPEAAAENMGRFKAMVEAHTPQPVEEK